jgi:flagellar biosynthesis protein FlhA
MIGSGILKKCGSWWRGKMTNETFGKFILFIMIIGVTPLLIIPLPAILLDILMVINLIIPLLMLLMAFNIRKPVEFSILPTMFLWITVFQLSLNVSSTRLILTRGVGFDGRLIRAIADFVLGSGNTGLLVGWFLLFIGIITVSIMVISKGSIRVFETSVRFVDTLSGKQMAIEARFGSGDITGEESLARKNALQREGDFIGSMDGAGIFILGNMKVGILITLINILGGIIIGTTLHGEPIMETAETYTSLVIGAGLLFQFPALLIFISAAIFVFRTSSETNV